KAGKTQKRLWDLVTQTMHQARPGDWNQALMELGALICVPDSPRCSDCPLSPHCAAFKKGWQDRLPQTQAGRKQVQLRWTCIWNEQGGKVLVHKRPESERFLPGHWGIPEARHLKKVKPGDLLATVRHTITHHQITVDLRDAQGFQDGLSASFRWVPKSRL